MSEQLREELIRRTSLKLATIDEEKHPEFKNIPRTIHRYHSIVPLEKPASRTAPSIFGYTTHVYKGISSTDGEAYAIRRIEGFRLTSENALKLGEAWRKIRHPNLVTLNEIFTSKEFGGTTSLFFSYDYHPGAENLDAKHFNQSNELIPESTLWSYIIQLLSLLRTVHNAGLACRILVPSKILVTGRNRYQRFKLLSPVKNPFELRRNL